MSKCASHYTTKNYIIFTDFSIIARCSYECELPKMVGDT